MTKVGEIDVLTRPELDSMIEQARQAVRDAGLPQSAVDRVKMLGFHCSDHGTESTLVAYQAGCVFVFCRVCGRNVGIFAVAESVRVIPEIKPGEAWN